MVFARWGEQLACNYLEKRGWEMLARNYRTRYGELDIVARKEGSLVFFEVKTRSSIEYGMPEEAVTEKKKEHLQNCAEAYIEEHPDVENNWRIDVLAIRVADDLDDPEVLWFENVV
jgi:putative endonuclease